MEPESPDVGLAAHRTDQLNSWKAIAAHLDRTVRTVQRWERTCHMPVYRHEHASSSSVYAYRSELDAWWSVRTPSATAESPPAQTQSSHTRCIAVLPFTDLSPTQDQQYYCDGIVEGLITSLAGIPGFKVISRSSVMRFREGSRGSLETIATLLAAQLLVEGSVQQDRDTVRINVRLVDPFRSGQVLWTETYDRPCTDVLEVQAEVAESVALRAQVSMTAEQRQAVGSPRKVDAQSHDAYLMGRFHWNKRTEAALCASLTYYAEAIEHDPLDALGYAGLAESYTTLSGNEFWAPAEGYTKGQAAARKALEIDPRSAEARVALAMVLALYEWQWCAAEDEFLQAVGVNPSCANAYHWYGLCLLNVGRTDEAMAAIRRAHVLDPLSPIITANLGRPLFYLRRYDKAISQFEKALALESTFWLAHLFLAWALTETRRLDEAAREAETAIAQSNGNTAAILTLADVYAASGEAQRAAETIATIPHNEGDNTGRYVSAFRIARVFARLNDSSRAFECLARSSRQRSLGSTTYLTLDPALDTIRGDPRFAAYVAQVGLQEMAF